MIHFCDSLWTEKQSRYNATDTRLVQKQSRATGNVTDTRLVVMAIAGSQTTGLTSNASHKDQGHFID